MKSFCIKTNNTHILDYLLERIEELDFEDLVYSKKEYKIYQNIVIHYLGKKQKEFNRFLCGLIEEVIVEFYEEKIMKQLINYNYFYFDEYEKTKILDNCLQMTDTEEYREWIEEDKIIQKEIEKYILENKSVILDGFVYFRLQEYKKCIDKLVDESVNQFLI